ncbi:YgaP family membrane protein [Kaarinaea lacus]
MQDSENLFDETRNLGLLERGVRIAIGTTAILAVLVSQNIGMLGWVALIPLLAIYPIMTGIIGYDPFYAWLGVNTYSSTLISDEQVRKYVRNITAEPFSSSDSKPDNKAESIDKHRDAA